jgi:hypothetical protein
MGARSANKKPELIALAFGILAISKHVESCLLHDGRSHRRQNFVRRYNFVHCDVGDVVPQRRLMVDATNWTKHVVVIGLGWATGVLKGFVVP